MTATLTLCKDPYRPLANRQTEYLRPGVRLSTVLRQYGYLKGRGERTRRPFPYIVAVNGEYVLQKTWTRRIKSGDTVAVIHQPEGGGGSNPLRIVAMIAILVLSVYTGGAVAGVYGATAGALASAAISIAGSMLLNMLFPVKPQ
ncbi:hypothetical protein GUH47_19785, partial [Xanthomonas citri pv. citri]|nr:hypothetical protein [Xanthomonas citri pv. citri]